LRGNQKFSLQLKIIRFSASGFGVNQNVRLAWNLMKAFSEDLPEQSFCPISDNSIPDLSRYRESQTMVPDFIFPPE
jgi:hypothetical protein